MGTLKENTKGILVNKSWDVLFGALESLAKNWSDLGRLGSVDRGVANENCGIASRKTGGLGDGVRTKMERRPVF